MWDYQSSGVLPREDRFGAVEKDEAGELSLSLKSKPKDSNTHRTAETIWALSIVL